MQFLLTTEYYNNEGIIAYDAQVMGARDLLEWYEMSDTNFNIEDFNIKLIDGHTLRKVWIDYEKGHSYERGDHYLIIYKGERQNKKHLLYKGYFNSDH